MRIVIVVALLVMPKAFGHHLTLHEAEQLALKNSPEIAAAQAELEGAEIQAAVYKARERPILSLDGSYRYVSEVPELELGPTSKPFGDHKGFSIGPVLRYSLFDGGVQASLIKSMEALADAKQETSHDVRRQTLLKLRLSYITAQIAGRENELVRRSLALAKRQRKDIVARYEAGAASKIDRLAANREVSTMEVRFAASQSRLETSFADLEAQMGYPLKSYGRRLESLEGAVGKMPSELPPEPEDAHPKLKTLVNITKSAELAADSQAEHLWPKVQLMVKSSLDYPNGPVLEQVHQNTLSVALSMPLFDWGAIDHSVSKLRSEVVKYRARYTATKREIFKEWTKARERIYGLRQQRRSAQKAVRESSELADLSYETYKSGGINLTDVQSSNLRLLSAKVQKARIDGELLIQFYLMQSFSDRG